MRERERERVRERERPLGLNPPEGTRRQYEKSFNRNRSGEVCLKFKRQDGHDVRCWCVFFSFSSLFRGRTRHRKSPKKTNNIWQPAVLYRCHNFFFFNRFFYLSGDSFCSHGLARSPSLMQGGGGGVRGFAGGREGGVGARIAEPRAR